MKLSFAAEYWDELSWSRLCDLAEEMGFAGIIVEGNYQFYNTVGFKTSSEYGIYPVSGYPMAEPRCQMCMELYPGSLKDRGGYVVYDMYYNA